MFTLVFDDDQLGTQDLAVPFPEVLQNVNWQVDPSTNDVWNVTISARLDAAMPWVLLKTVDHADNPLELIFELAPYPNYQVEITEVGTVPANIRVGASFAPSIASVVTRTTPASAHAAVGANTPFVPAP